MLKHIEITLYSGTVLAGRDIGADLGTQDWHNEASLLMGAVAQALHNQLVSLYYRQITCDVRWEHGFEEVDITGWDGVGHECNDYTIDDMDPYDADAIKSAIEIACLEVLP